MTENDPSQHVPSIQVMLAILIERAGGEIYFSDDDIAIMQAHIQGPHKLQLAYQRVAAGDQHGYRLSYRLQTAPPSEN